MLNFFKRLFRRNHFKKYKSQLTEIFDIGNLHLLSSDEIDKIYFLLINLGKQVEIINRSQSQKAITGKLIGLNISDNIICQDYYNKFERKIVVFLKTNEGIKYFPLIEIDEFTVIEEE